MGKKNPQQYRNSQYRTAKRYSDYLKQSDEETKDRARVHPLTDEDRKKILAYDKLGKRFCDYN